MRDGERDSLTGVQEGAGGMELQEIRERIRGIVREILEEGSPEGKAPEEIGDDESLIDGGLIDSIGAIRLIEACHTVFDIVISPAELSVENFDSIGRIVSLVHGKLLEMQE